MLNRTEKKLAKICEIPGKIGKVEHREFASPLKQMENCGKIYIYVIVLPCWLWICLFMLLRLSFYSILFQFVE